MTARGYKLVEMFLTSGRGGRPGRKITLKAVVIHWTANTNPGADAVANRNYFENHPQNYVSAHYIVDDHQVVQCLPEDEMGYHVGARKYRQEALKLLSSYPNNCTIGIEICVNSDADFRKTYHNAVALTADILRRHGWDAGRLWRHYDVTGKDCPRFFVNDATAQSFGFPSAAGGWAQFKQDVSQALRGEVNDGMFKDMAGHWAEGSIEEAAKLGLVSGKGDGTFAPDENMTRAQGTVVVLRAYKDLMARIKTLEERIMKLEGRG